MEKTLANYTKKFARVIVIGGASFLTIYGAFAYVAYENRKSYKNLLQSYQENPPPKDQIPDIGIGDIFFFNHACIKSFSVKDMRNCAIHKIYHWSVSSEEQSIRYRQGKWLNSAIAIKSKDETIIFHNYYGKLYQTNYEEFLNLPYISNISLRKLETDIAELDVNSHEFIEEFRDVIDVINNSWPNHSAETFRDTIDVILNFWLKAGIADPGKMHLSLKQGIGDIDCEFPTLLNSSIAKYSKQWPIRSITK